MEVLNDANDRYREPVNDQMKKHGFIMNQVNDRLFLHYNHETFKQDYVKVFMDLSAKLLLEHELSETMEDFTFRYKTFHTLENVSALDQSIFRKDYKFVVDTLDWIRNNTIPIQLPTDLGCISEITFNANYLIENSFIQRIRLGIDRYEVWSPAKDPVGCIDFKYNAFSSMDKFEFRFWKELPQQLISKDRIQELYRKVVDWSADPNNSFRVFCQSQLNPGNLYQVSNKN